MEIALGFAIALAISLTGVVAGTMTTPLLILLLGVSPPTAVGTALAFGAIVKVASVPVYAMRRQVNLRVLGCLIAATAVYRLYRVFKPAPPRPDRDRVHLLPWFALPIGAEVGFSSAGAGALGSLLLLSMTPLSAAEVIGTDLCFGLGLAATGSIIQVGAGNYDSALLLKLVIGGLAGAFTGSMLAGRIAQKPLRVGLLVALIILGCRLALHA